MARIHLEAPWARHPMASRHERLGAGHAAIQWACGRRGRVAIVTVLLFLVVVVLMAGAKRSEALSSSYRTLSSNYYHLSAWRPHLPHLPSSIPTSIRKPSSTALQLENGTIAHVPSRLRKSSPNFHLLLASPEHDLNFCKTTMSAMIMNYPPPTIVSIFDRPELKANWEREKLERVLVYLEDKKVVKDEDLVMLVDGRDTWFQVPSEVMIRQYMDAVADANRHVRRMYGKQFSQTIVFGARKICEGDELVCANMPPSILPREIYGMESEEKTELLPARYLDGEMVMGPVEDLRALFKRAVEVFEGNQTPPSTLTSVMGTVFAEQTLARKEYKKETRPVVLKWYDHLVEALARPKGEEETPQLVFQADRQYEFSVGLDYTHALFQPLTECAEDELFTTARSNISESSQHRGAKSLAPSFELPSAFINATGPFWRPDFGNDEASPNDKPSYIDKLEFRYELDKLPRRDTSWENISFIQNTYTGAIPATFHVTYRRRSSEAQQPSGKRDSFFGDVRSHTANVTWTSLWYSGYERALLRRYFRTPQSSIGYHTAAVGGDLLWDQRGGRGGVWTAESALWMPWGEVDGVCGTYEILKDVFGDKKGVWFHEDEDGGGKRQREAEEYQWEKHLEEEKARDQEWMAALEKEKMDREKSERESMEKERLQREESERVEKEAKAALGKQAAEAAARVEEGEAGVEGA